MSTFTYRIYIIVLTALTHSKLHPSLALMPEGDHLNIIDPPGLTVMRIAGGRYRVTGAVSSYSV